MNKIITTFVCIIISSFTLWCQNTCNRFDVGVGYAPLFFFSVDDGIQADYKYNAYFEWRLNISKNIDIGAKLDYKVSPASAFDMANSIGYSGSEHFASLLALVDLNFFPDKAVNPFIGIGIGPDCVIYNWTSSEKVPRVEDYSGSLNPEAGITVIASPRIGIELFRHLRLSTSMDISFRPSITRWPICFSIGWTF